MTKAPQIRNAVVFDLEFTSWDGSLARRWLGPGEFKELVQIGAVALDARTLRETGSLDVLVKPRLNAVLSDYLQALTAITNADVAARGVDFLAAYTRFVEFAEGATIFAFGRDDLVFTDNIRLYGIVDAPPVPPYRNIVPWLIANGIDTKGMHACDVGPRAGAPFEGHMHNALDDARSVAAGIRALVAKGAANPFEGI
jgi:inhibitor of KinA sporulation pathway (predicted exonuclease)